MEKVPVTGALFAAFLGYDPVKAIISSLPPPLASSIPPSAVDLMESRGWFPEAIASAFMGALRETFYFGAVLSFVAALSSALRGKAKIVLEGGESHAERANGR